MKHTNFIKKYLGQQIDYDNVNGCQCVDTAKQYSHDVLGLKPQSLGYAKDWWLNRRKEKFINDNFTFIDPFKHDIKTGDLGIRTSGKYGHIFIIDSYNETTNTMIYYDTNATGHHDPLTKRVKVVSSDNITGILRPKNQININASVNNGVVVTDCPCTMFKTNAYSTKKQTVYADNKREQQIGCIPAGEKFKVLAQGSKNTIVQYGIDKRIYKTGIILTEYVKFI